jgi:hypothetical protein
MARNVATLSPKQKLYSEVNIDPGTFVLDVSKQSRTPIYQWRAYLSPRRTATPPAKKKNLFYALHREAMKVEYKRTNSGDGGLYRGC